MWMLSDAAVAIIIGLGDRIGDAVLHLYTPPRPPDDVVNWFGHRDSPSRREAQGEDGEATAR